MISQKIIAKQLKSRGIKTTFLNRPEIMELSKVLMVDEQIQECISGFYNGVFALLCVTNQRVLLVDKRPFFLNIEDIRFDMISETDFRGRLLDSGLTLRTMSKVFSFSSWRTTQLRTAFTHIQQNIHDTKQNHWNLPISNIQDTSKISWRRRPISKYQVGQSALSGTASGLN